jgi:hypothetical protein
VGCSAQSEFISLGALSPDEGTWFINTDTLHISGARSFFGVAVNQSSGPQVAVFTFSNINIPSIGPDDDVIVAEQEIVPDR